MKRRVPSVLKVDLQRWRMRLVMLIIFSAFGVLVAQLSYMQIWKKDFLRQQSDKRVKRLVDIPAHRGMLLDARGVHLAISIPAAAIGLNAREAEATPEQRSQLAHLLGLDRAALDRIFREKKKFTYLARQIQTETADAVMTLKIKGVTSQPEYRRYYTAGETMAQVLGLTNIEDRGLDGIELSYQSSLGGVSGKKRVIRDRAGNVVEELELVQLPKKGADLMLSINSQIQYLAFRELKAATLTYKAKAASAVVLDAQTGEILAIANYPSYNPNERRMMRPELARNRAAADAFEPGSTLKPLFVAAALEQQKITPGTLIDTSAPLLLSGKRITDTHENGVVSVTDAIQVSSNVAMARIAMSMQDRDIYSVYSAAGFGRLPNSGLPGEARGILHDTRKPWLPIEKAALSYGHGVSVSLLQLARAYTLLANDGVLMPLTVVKRTEPVTGTRVVSAQSARQVRIMLEKVVQEGGTAPKARVLGYSVAGKTGTAHKLVNGNFNNHAYRASFVGMAPASNPRVVIAVVVDEPSGVQYYGGEVAAPAFSRIMAGTLRFLAIPPDAPMEALPPVRSTVVKESA
ncbi:MAG: penicillin-binding protein 2 [Betaproteobacteria bacterium]|nr:MAG: penicillin-binding protein 2 [Betaproteobacteria bacterium]